MVTIKALWASVQGSTVEERVIDAIVERTNIEAI